MNSRKTPYCHLSSEESGQYLSEKVLSDSGNPLTNIFERTTQEVHQNPNKKFERRYEMLRAQLYLHPKYNVNDPSLQASKSTS